MNPAASRGRLGESGSLPPFRPWSQSAGARRRLGWAVADTCRNDSFLLKSRQCSNNRKKKGRPAATSPVPNPDIKD
jgi:hypothetical protein